MAAGTAILISSINPEGSLEIRHTTLVSLFCAAPTGKRMRAESDHKNTFRRAS
jgi:hypothetical protein